MFAAVRAPTGFFVFSISENLTQMVDDVENNRDGDRSSSEAERAAVKDIDDTTAVSNYTQIPKRTLEQYRYLSKGPRYLRIEGGRVLYRKSDVDAWLASQVVDVRTAV